MIISIGGLPQGRTTIRSRERPEDLGFEKGEMEFLAPVDVVAEAIRMGFDVYVDCTMRTAVELECGRCLERFRTDLQIRLQMLFVPAEQSGKVKHANHGVFPYRESIDLAEHIAEAIREEMPMKPLCKPDCRGLCPQCGQNLNEGDCGCREEEEGYHPFKDMKL
jgi:uncharacterized protein